MEQSKKEEYGFTLLFTSEILQLTFQSVCHSFSSSLTPAPLKNKTPKILPCPGSPLQEKPIPLAIQTPQKFTKIHFQASAATLARSLLATLSLSLRNSLSGASQSCAKIICPGLQFDQSENSVLTGSVMIKDGCAHVKPAAATDLSVFLLVTWSSWWQTGHEDHVGPDPPRSESNCLLRVQEIGKIRGVFVLVDEGSPLPNRVLVSLTAFFLRTWGDSDRRVLRLCSLYPSAVIFSAGKASAPRRSGVEGRVASLDYSFAQAASSP